MTDLYVNDIVTKVQWSPCSDLFQVKSKFLSL